MTHYSVVQLVHEVSSRVGGVRPLVPAREMRKHYDNDDISQVTRIIMDAMGIDLQLRLAKVRTGGNAHAPAWVDLPVPMPPYGTEAFRHTLITIYIRYDFLHRAPFETVVFMLAHEMAHIVLYSIGHPLRRDERTTDVAAMVLGFAEYYEQGVVYEEPRPFRFADGKGSLWRGIEDLCNMCATLTYRKAGYLAPDEVRIAATLIREMRESKKRRA